MTQPSQGDTTGLAIAGLVLGVLAIVLSPLVVGLPLGFAGLAVAIGLARQRPARRAMLRWAVGLSTLGVLGSGAAGALYYHLYKEWRAQWASRGGVEHPTDNDAPDWVGVRVPEMKLTTLEGETVDVAHLTGRPVVLNFWATWCAACRQELPHLERLAREVPEVMVIGISDEPEATLSAYTKKQPIGFRVASMPSPPKPFDGVEALPTTVFVDRKGVVREVHVGYQDFDTLRAKALGADYEGAPHPPSITAAPKGVPLTVKQRWELTVPAATSIAACPWDGEAGDEVVVLASDAVLHVIDSVGREATKITLPAAYAHLECAAADDRTARLLGYDHWGRSIAVMDAQGRALWSYPASTGANGAHWGDLDGDGQPELVAGFNGDGGLHAVSSTGRRLWHVKEIGNVWTQAVLPATDDRAAVVAASEAGGTVRLFDGEGSQTAELRPLGDYYTAVALAPSGAGVQLVATGRKRVVAFDAHGTVAWQMPMPKTAEGAPGGFFAGGDVAGDGTPEWVFPVKARQLAVVSASGALLAEIARPPGAPFAAVAGRAPGQGLVVVLDQGTVRAYALE